ncbi:aminotransferase class I/II-fold pyridoxal phosphate-dependent enzyme [Herbiconiux moechotypicola]|uniref:cysteine-S-conjugate beta-lyase n=1 Tax=Herbiconiux moechotypicola TaxID=637393 RepID=A0ABN3DE25_9MICO|nr:aminotransferase class I/II-fold pyridoxal phosphate-dependent enzyme [Herbiconiux moechotypicola]MCS5729254.1 aminotransferase class I/II-fold pyridoxal phosphate-dependent enzyme [Herbiconiux moechotypicola]
MSGSSPFDRIDEGRLRSGAGVKWGAVAPEVLPAWVADMDFGIPGAVREALSRAVAREDLGYPFWPGGDPVVLSFERRMRRFGWTPEPGRTRVFTDLIQVLQVMIEHATEPGDGVAVHVPAYPPFLAAIERSGRRIIPIAARLGARGWTFDDEGLPERLRRDSCRLLLLVNPHNPTGRVFDRHELTTLATIAADLDLVVLSDEIHADLTYGDREHIPFASVSPDAAARTITATSATKAFNIAGMRCAVAHIGPDEVRDRIEREPLDYFGQPSILSRVATCAAWDDSGPWLDGLRLRLAENRAIVADWVESRAGVAHVQPEATYLAWLDFGATAIGSDPAGILHRRGGVLLSEGAEFSQHTIVDTRSFARLNFATSEQVLLRALARVDAVLDGAPDGLLDGPGHAPRR